MPTRGPAAPTGSAEPVHGSLHAAALHHGEAAFSALRQLSERGEVDLLRDIARRGHAERVREEALALLGGAGTDVARELLSDADAPAIVRGRALRLLRDFAPDDLREALSALAPDALPATVAVAALTFAARVGDAAYVRAGLRDERAPVVQAAVDALRRTGRGRGGAAAVARGVPAEDD